MMGWAIHPAKFSFPDFIKDWDRLNRLLNQGHPYFDSRFVGPLLQHFATGKELLCLYYDADIISSALILQPDSLGRWKSFCPSQAQVTAILVDDARKFDALFKALPTTVWTIELPAIDPRFSPDFSQCRLPWIAHPQAHTIGIELHQSFPEFRKNRPKKLISNIDRYQRRADQEFGALRFTCLTRSNALHAGLQRYGELESSGWKGAAGTAVSIDNVQGNFYSEVLRKFSSTQQAAIYELYAGDTLASSRLVISSDKLHVFLKTAYEESLSRFAPGRLLLYRVIDTLFNTDREKQIEFYTNTTRDQKEWATFECVIQNIRLFRNNFLANGFTILKALLRNNKPTKNSPDELVIGSCENLESLAKIGINPDGFHPNRELETSSDWFGLLQNAVYRQDSGVRYCYAIDGNRHATILPLRLVKNGFIKTIESLSNFYSSLYAPLRNPESDQFILRHLLHAAEKDHQQAHVMRFAPMDPDSAAYTVLLNELRATGWIPFRFFCFNNWYLKVSGTWDDYLKSRTANLRSNIKRPTKKFLDSGGMLEVFTDDSSIEKAIAAFQAVYSTSWKIPEPYPEFVPALIRHLAANRMLRLGIAWLHNKPIAAQLWFVRKDKASIYKVAYDETFASLSSGTVLTSHLMQYVIDQDRVTEVDFLIGDDEYKKRWMSHVRERWGIVAYNPRTLWGMALLAKEVSGRMVKPWVRHLKNLLGKINKSTQNQRIVKCRTAR